MTDWSVTVGYQRANGLWVAIGRQLTGRVLRIVNGEGRTPNEAYERLQHRLKELQWK